MKYFYSSIFILAIGLAIAFYLGSWEALYITLLLSILEVSLSFDNAVVNAKVLENMTKEWQQRFIYIGLPIAVFGMRFIFPIVIVAVAGGMGVYETFNLAIENPVKYHEMLEHNKLGIYAFGGAFLLMVFMDFFFDDDREEKWIHILEDNKITNKLSDTNNIELIIAMVVGLILIHFTNSSTVAMAYFGGILLHSIISSLDDIMSLDGIRSGLMGLLYLEVLDASFSFDGVIGAFALSSNIFIIMIGLGIGAMFVRSLTLYLVEKKTLQEYIYLEHGAHYAIFALATIMLLKIFFEVSEALTGTIGIAFILIAYYSSIRANKLKAVEND